MKLQQKEFDFNKLPKYNENVSYPWSTKPVYISYRLTEKGLLGKDDVYRLFHMDWQDPITGELVKRHIFFKFLREIFEIELSQPRHPRLRAQAVRASMVDVFMVWGKKPVNDIAVYGSGVRNTHPPRPRFDNSNNIPDRFPSVRITPTGVCHLQVSWGKWIKNYYNKMLETA